jgi:hypothetical protein
VPHQSLNNTIKDSHKKTWLGRAKSRAPFIYGVINHMIKILLTLLLFPILCFAKAGPEIELPSVSYTEAVTISSNALLSSGCIIGDGQDYILSSLRYTKDSMESSMYWEIEFIHPKYNDHKVTYRMDNDKKLELFECIE